MLLISPHYYQCVWPPTKKLFIIYLKHLDQLMICKKKPDKVWTISIPDYPRACQLFNNLNDTRISIIFKENVFSKKKYSWSFNSTEVTMKKLMQHGNGNENLPYRLIIGMTHEFVLKYTQNIILNRPHQIMYFYSLTQ